MLLQRDWNNDLFQCRRRVFHLLPGCVTEVSCINLQLCGCICSCNSYPFDKGINFCLKVARWKMLVLLIAPKRSKWFFSWPEWLSIYGIMLLWVQQIPHFDAVIVGKYWHYSSCVTCCFVFLGGAIYVISHYRVFSWRTCLLFNPQRVNYTSFNIFAILLPFLVIN